MKKPVGACATCGSTGFQLTALGHCIDVNACAHRRQTKHLPKGRCIVMLQRYGSVYYLEEFQERSVDVNFEIKPARYHYQAVLERSAATTFDADKAMALAKACDGVVVEKK
jgi:hypothetical protein